MKVTLDNPAGVGAPFADRFSHVARLDHGDGALLLLSGQVAVDDEGAVIAPGDAGAQAARVFQIIEGILAAHGAAFADVMHVRTFMTSLADLPAYAAVRRRYFPGPPPASTAVEVSRLFLPGLVLEVEVTAAVGASARLPDRPGGAGTPVGQCRHALHGDRAVPARARSGVRAGHGALMGDSGDPYRLERFVTAQDRGGMYQRALAELRAGLKVSHWIWFVFPQIAGLGHSAMAREYAISSLAEARAYLAHPVLGPRLAESAGALLAAGGKAAEDILGPVDAVKVRSSMTLFQAAAPGAGAFGDVLERFYGGIADEATVSRLA
jgi:2-iminobutanoate/2-iminopropanoate deaminase